jgi:hypothetical protein
VNWFTRADFMGAYTRWAVPDVCASMSAENVFLLAGPRCRTCGLHHTLTHRRA